MQSFVSEHRTPLSVEIDRYISFTIFKHFTIIGIVFFLFVTYTIIQSIASSEMCSLYLTHPSAHTPGAVDNTDTHTQEWTHTHTWSSGHTHTHTPGAVDTHTHTHTHTHTWSSGHTHTPGAVDTHTHLEQWTHTHTPGAVDTHTHTPGAVDTHTHTHTHTWSSGHCSLRRSSSTITACNFIQDSLCLKHAKLYEH